MGRRATLIYVGSVVVTAIGFGLLVDLLLPASWCIPSAMHGVACHGGLSDVSLFATACSILLAGLLIYTSIKFRGHGHAHNHNHNLNDTDMERKYRIKGMSCPHCQATVTKVLSALEGVESVTVALSSGIAPGTGDVNDEAVSKAGYDAAFNLVEG